ncbi:MobH family relaxase [Stutzerimonas kunmingensis]|uniref:MobH family relaxase n=1 Tax=Stutzerimonas kunmingensis TaxID=1211807 RepID=UPI0028A948C4|nr:MobH family relaxase [Stutzerimonas kunmingensis]
MNLFIAIWNYLFNRKPERSELLTQWNDPWFGHPGYKDLPPALLAEVGDPRLLHYPPYDYGYFGFLSGEYYMRTFQAELMNKLERQSGLSPEQFKNYLEPILLAYAELVHFLPASQHHHHNYMGGLIRHGLETACFMLDWMVLTKFDHELTPANASMRLRRWYVAGIIAALFHDAGKAITDVKVLSFEGDQEWCMGTKTIHEWAVQNHLTRYFITWVKDRHERHKQQTTVLIGTLVTTEIREWLIEGGTDIWVALVSATGDQPGPLTRAVKIADSRSVRSDCERHGNADNGSSVSIRQLCLDAMRYMIDDRTWTFNGPDSRLWKTHDGIFLVWDAGSAEIIQHATRDTANNFPSTDSDLLAAMSENELIEKCPDGSLLWLVAPHGVKNEGHSLHCVKLKNAREIFRGVLEELAPVPAIIGRRKQQSLPVEADATAEEHYPKHEKLAALLTVPAKFRGRLSDEQRNYLCTNPTLGSQLLSEFEHNSQIREVQNRAFLPMALSITLADLPALSSAGWLGPNLATTCDELTRVNRGETGVMLNTKMSLIFSQLTNAKWFPRCHATLPDELRTQVIRYAIALAPYANEEAGRGAKTYSLSFWARDKFQRAHDLSQDEVEQAILYGLEAIKISNERKYYFAADLEFEL